MVLGQRKTLRLYTRRVRQLPKVLLLFKFFCRKLHENERIWTPGGASLAPPWIRQCMRKLCVQFEQCGFYHPRKRIGNNFIRVCPSVCVSVQAITFEPLQLETSFSVHTCTFTISRSVSSTKAIDEDQGQVNKIS